MNDKHFTDWESNIFGFGYGSGEVYTLPILLKFFNNLSNDGHYEYDKMEKKLGKTGFWLLLNILCHADIVEYGTSPRYGWMTKKGEILREYLKNKKIDDLYELTSRDGDYIYCYPDVCNCEKSCNNPLFTNRR